MAEPKNYALTKNIITIADQKEWINILWPKALQNMGLEIALHAKTLAHVQQCFQGRQRLNQIQF